MGLIDDRLGILKSLTITWQLRWLLIRDWYSQIRNQKPHRWFLKSGCTTRDIINHSVLDEVLNKMEDTASWVVPLYLHALQWRRNERNGVSDRQHLDCLHIKKHQALLSLAFVSESTGGRWPVDSDHQGPVAQQMFPLDDFIMCNSRPYKCFN